MQPYQNQPQRPIPYVPQSIAETQAALEAGTLSKSGENYVQHMLYDTVPLSANSVSSADRFFSTPSGQTQNGLQKSDIHTNMRDSSKLPAGMEVNVTGMSVSWIIPAAGRADIAKAMTVLSAIDAMMRQSRFRLIVPPREYEAEIPGSIFVPNKAAYSSTTGAGGYTNATDHGWETAPFMYNLKTSIPLAGLDTAPITFYVEHMLEDQWNELPSVYTACGSAYPWRQIRLHGTLRRP